MIDSISAADNAIIKLQDGWQLIQHDHVLAEAKPQGLVYNLDFGASRRLPADGLLPREAVEQVVLGWQASDETWYLGLVVARELALLRQSRWCALARWPDPDASVFGELGAQAGQALAHILGVPFVYVPPRPSAPPPPTRELPPLPLSLGNWEMHRAERAETRLGASLEPGDLYFIHSPRWRRYHLGRALWFALCAVVYVVVSVATLGSRLALPNSGTLIPNPHILPYLGLSIAVGLLFSSLGQLFTLSRSINLIQLSRNHLTWWRGGRVVRQIPAQDIQSLYVSEVIKRRERGSLTEHGEINAHLGGGRFELLISQGVPLSSAAQHPSDSPQGPRQLGVHRLTRDSYRTDLQAATLYLAEALGLPAWEDVRHK
ncbi:MAG: hypothetical protein NZ750_02505 [Anaerolineae bacterium]|nr:hypothetical protein [Anaerolineae bacterium]MDW8173449.1 hypothetical protein [Anaerolineae bacterium]